MPNASKVEVIYHDGSSACKAFAELALMGKKIESAVVVLQEESGELAIMRIGLATGPAAANLLLDAGKHMLMETFFNAEPGDQDQAESGT